MKEIIQEDNYFRLLQIMKMQLSAIVITVFKKKTYMI